MAEKEDGLTRKEAAIILGATVGFVLLGVALMGIAEAVKAMRQNGTQGVAGDGLAMAAKPQTAQQAYIPPAPIPKRSFRGRVYRTTDIGPVAVADNQVILFACSQDVDPIVSYIIRWCEYRKTQEQKIRLQENENDASTGATRSPSAETSNLSLDRFSAEHQRNLEKLAEVNKRMKTLAAIMELNNQYMEAINKLQDQLTAKVKENPSGGTARTNFEGRFAFSGIPQGDYWVMVSYGTNVQTVFWLKRIGIGADMDIELTNSNAVMVLDSR